MKCIKNIETGQIARVSDQMAHLLVRADVAVYIPKKEWKLATHNMSKGN